MKGSVVRKGVSLNLTIVKLNFCCCDYEPIAFLCDGIFFFERDGDVVQGKGRGDGPDYCDRENFGACTSPMSTRTAGATVARSTPDRKVIRSNRVWFNSQMKPTLKRLISCVLFLAF